MDAQTLDDTDRAIVRGLLFSRRPFDVPAGEMPADQLRDIAARTRSLEPHVKRFQRSADAARQRMREKLLSLSLAL